MISHCVLPELDISPATYYTHAKYSTTLMISHRVLPELDISPHNHLGLRTSCHVTRSPSMEGHEDLVASYYILPLR